jgi:hypothetical protein
MIQSTTAVIIAITMANLAVAQQYEAMMEMGQGMSPRYFLGASKPAKRQATCGQGYHNCKLASMSAA